MTGCMEGKKEEREGKGGRGEGREGETRKEGGREKGRVPDK